MRQGLILIELMVVIAIIAAIAIFNFLESRITANESAATVSLKSGIFVGEMQFQNCAYSDVNNDGRGEYANCTAWIAGANQIAKVSVGAVKQADKFPSQNFDPNFFTLFAPTYNLSGNVFIGVYKHKTDTNITPYAPVLTKHSIRASEALTPRRVILDQTGAGLFIQCSRS